MCASFLLTEILFVFRNRLQHVRLGSALSDLVMCSTQAPQGTVLSSVLFPSDFQYNSWSRHPQKYCNNSSGLMHIWSGHLHLKVNKTREMATDFRSGRTADLCLSWDRAIMLWKRSSLDSSPTTARAGKSTQRCCAGG